MPVNPWKGVGGVLALAVLEAVAAAQSLPSARDLVAFTTATAETEPSTVLLAIQGDTTRFKGLWPDTEVVVREVALDQVAKKSARLLMVAAAAKCGIAAVPSGEGYQVTRVGSCAATQITWDPESVSEPGGSTPPQSVVAVPTGPIVGTGKVAVDEVRLRSFATVTAATREALVRGATEGLAAAGLETAGVSEGGSLDPKGLADARFVLRGELTDLRVRKGARPAAEATVRWELKDRDHDSTVYVANTRGYSDQVGGSSDDRVALAVSAAAQALRDRAGFVTAVTRPSFAEVSALPPPSWAQPVQIARCVTEPVVLPKELPRRLPSVTIVQAEVPDGTSTGTGVFISPDGFLLTVHHVVDGATSIEVRTHSGEAMRAEVVRSDGWHDAALLKVQGTDLPCAPVAPEPGLGSDLFAVGNPVGGKVTEFSVARGIVSGVRTLDGYRLIQTDASLNQGFSGGPLFDEVGAIVALTSFGIRETNGLGFGIPSDTAMERLGAVFAGASSADLDSLKGEVVRPDFTVALVDDETAVAPTRMGEEGDASQRSARKVMRITGGILLGVGVAGIVGTWTQGTKDELYQYEWTSLQAFNSLGWVVAVGGAATIGGAQLVQDAPTIRVHGRF